MGWLQQLFSRHRRYDELSESIREHIDEKVADLMDRGMTREQAERNARIDFGNMARIEERSREVWQWPTVESIWADIRFALRQLWKTPAFAITAILTLALGMAATVAIFGFVDSALIRPLPYRHPSALVQIFETRPQSGSRSMFSYDNYRDLERLNKAFTFVAAYDVRRNFVLKGASGAEQVNGIAVTDDFFRTLGISPALGRDFDAGRSTDGLAAAPATVILSYAAWQKYFNGRQDVLGKGVTLNGALYTIIGVLPRSFQFAPTGATEFWTTLHAYASDGCELHRQCLVMNVIGRLKNGVSIQQALANAQEIAEQDAKQYPDADRAEGANIVPLSKVILGDIQPILLALLGGAGLLLLIAYINVASLLLVRSEGRKREFAVRGALGAARARLIQQFVAEGFVMVVVSSILGLLASTLTQRLLLKLIPTDMLNSMPYLRGIGWNWHVGAFAIALIVIACVLFAFTPALRLSFTDLHAGLTEGDRRAAGTAWRRIGARLVVLELATTMVLLAGAGLLGKSFYKLLHVDIGFVPDHLATLQIIAPASGYSTSPRQIELHKEVMRHLQNLPGVTAVGTADGLPVGWTSSTDIEIVGQQSLGDHNEVGDRQVSSGYFSVLKAQLLRGRYFEESDNATSPRVVIINQSLAQRYFTGENPIGKQIVFRTDPQHPMQVVGVISDIKEGALDEKDAPFMYRPFQQSPNGGFAVVVRSSQDAASVLPSMITAVHKIDPNIAVSDATTMPHIIEDSSSAYLHRASAWLAGGFAVLALALSLVGLYGVISYSVSQRTREIGVRMALGAQRSSVYQLVLKEAGWLALIGSAIGIAGSIGAGMLLRSLLFDVQSWDVSILAAVAIMVVFAALIASYIPARRAASVDPMRALRSE